MATLRNKNTGVIIITDDATGAIVGKFKKKDSSKKSSLQASESEGASAALATGIEKSSRQTPFNVPGMAVGASIDVLNRMAQGKQSPIPFLKQAQLPTEFPSGVEMELAGRRGTELTNKVSQLAMKNPKIAQIIKALGGFMGGSPVSQMEAPQIAQQLGDAGTQVLQQASPTNIGMIVGGMKGVPSKTQIGRMKAEQVTLPKGKLEVKLAEADALKNTITDQINNVSKSLDNLTVDSARIVQNELPSVTKDASIKYGTFLDEISDKVEGKIKNLDYKAMVDDTIRQVDELQLPDNSASKFLLEKSKELEQASLGGDISLKEINKFRRELQNKSKIVPTKKPGVESVVINRFNDSYGNLLNTFDISNDVKVLNNSYRQSAQALNQSWKTFKPYTRGGQFDVSSGASLIKKVAQGDASLAERELVQILQGGDESFIRGIGDFTSKPKEIADLLKTITNNNPTAAGSLNESINATLFNLERELTKQGRRARSSRLVGNMRDFRDDMKIVNRLQSRKRFIEDIKKRWIVITALSLGIGATGYA